MIKVVALLHRRDDLSREEFIEHWREKHPAFVRELPGLRRYVQSLAQGGDASPYDGMAEVWFDDKAACREALASPVADAVREDERRFIGSMDWFIAEEVVMLGDHDRRPG